jgi:hypothetical protein
MTSSALYIDQATGHISRLVLLALVTCISTSSKPQQHLDKHHG